MWLLLVETAGKLRRDETWAGCALLYFVFCVYDVGGDVILGIALLFFFSVFIWTRRCEWRRSRIGFLHSTCLSQAGWSLFIHFVDLIMQIS